MTEIVAVGFCGVFAALAAFFGGVCLVLCRERHAVVARQKKQERKSAEEARRANRETKRFPDYDGTRRQDRSEEAQRMNREIMNFLNYDGTRQQDPSEEA